MADLPHALWATAHKVSLTTLSPEEPMTTYLSDHTGRNNNFNLIRFVAAISVLISHSYALTFGSGTFEPFKSSLGMSLGSIAVDVFFVTSGYLVAASLYRQDSLKAFIYSRVLRIWPALIVVIIASTFILGPYFTSLSMERYFADVQTYKYFLKNATLFFGVEYRLPGVFETAPYADAVNGSLWTLPYEVRLYCMLAMLGLVSKIIVSKTPFKSVSSIFLTISVCAVILNIYVHYTGLEVPQRKLLHLFSVFFTGATIYMLREYVALNTLIAILAVIAILVATSIKAAFFVVYLFTLPYLTLYIAYKIAGPILKFNQLGDLSYGIYIYAFPIQQIIVTLQPETQVIELIFKAGFYTLIFAGLSWFLIEKPTLAYKSKLVSSHDAKTRINVQ